MLAYMLDAKTVVYVALIDSGVLRVLPEKWLITVKTLMDSPASAWQYCRLERPAKVQTDWLHEINRVADSKKSIGRNPKVFLDFYSDSGASTEAKERFYRF